MRNGGLYVPTISTPSNRSAKLARIRPSTSSVDPSKKWRTPDERPMSRTFRKRSRPRTYRSGYLSGEAGKPDDGPPVGEYNALIDEPAVGVILVRQGDVSVRQVDVCTCCGCEPFDHVFGCGFRTGWLELQTADGLNLYCQLTRLTNCLRRESLI